ncbi:Dyp-type peroxidase [Amycolatopsis alba]|uniref:Dyp-type peroxidase n=1 Tax=Amycolatopsis alba TaxID=76020 RepID=UPI00036B299D|nr:Dyp-type peroxidase [Amycolatopsis alba]
MTTGRRAFLLGATASAAGLGLSACSSGESRTPPHTLPSFRGLHQAGILDPAPRSLLFVALDLSGGADRRSVDRVLEDWSHAIEPATRGNPDAPELAGLDTLGLTVTIGVGPGLPDRIGLTAPKELAPIPALPGDRLQPDFCGGDLAVQICSNDPLVSLQTAQALTRLGQGVLTTRWRLPGFTQPGPATPRNAFGFKDGTGNPRTAAEIGDAVWITDGPWRHGTFLAVRRIPMDVQRFAALPTHQQEAVIGSRRDTGAPLTGRDEFDEIDLFAKHPDGTYVLPVDAHSRRAHARFDGGRQMLRRGFTYSSGNDETGLLFLAFMKDPALFTRVQTRLAEQDALNAFIRHTGSAVFLMLPGTGDGSVLRLPG